MVETYSRGDIDFYSRGPGIGSPKQSDYRRSIDNMTLKPIRTLLLALLVFSGYAFAQSNQTVMLDLSACTMTATTTAFTAGPALARVAAGNIVLQGTTNSTSGTITLDCDLSGVPLRLGSIGKINSVNVFYGLQTTALASIGAAAVQRVTYPNSTAAGVAAAGTVSSALGGTITVTPTALQLTTTTTGQCFNQMLRFGTPLVPAGNSKLSLEQVFTTNGGGSTVTVFQICAVQINYTAAPTSQSVN
jgi:hypothetical protein